MIQTSINDDLIYVDDDDHAISKLVAFNLKARGYQVKQFDNGGAVLDDLAADGPALIIMDFLMPGVNGLEVTRKVGEVSTVPIIILSVRDETLDKMAALDMGADDYVTKPFRVEELLARVRAILRRSARPSDSSGSDSHYQCGDLSIDLECQEVSSHEKLVHLTQQEWK